MATNEPDPNLFEELHLSDGPLSVVWIPATGEWKFDVKGKRTVVKNEELEILQRLVVRAIKLRDLAKK